MATAPFFFGTPKNTKLQLGINDGTSARAVMSGAANGSKVVAVIATSDDTAAKDLKIGIIKSGTFYPIAAKNIPITAGQVSSVAAVNMLDPSYAQGLPVDNDGQPYLFLESTDQLGAALIANVTSGKLISVTVVHGDG